MSIIGIVLFPQGQGRGAGAKEQFPINMCISLMNTDLVCNHHVEALHHDLELVPSSMQAVHLIHSLTLSHPQQSVLLNYLHKHWLQLKHKTRLRSEFNNQGKVAEWSKALGLGPSIFGCVGSNPTLVKFLYYNDNTIRNKNKVLETTEWIFSYWKQQNGYCRIGNKMDTVSYKTFNPGPPIIQLSLTS